MHCACSAAGTLCSGPRCLHADPLGPLAGRAGHHVAPLLSSNTRATVPFVAGTRRIRFSPNRPIPRSHGAPRAPHARSSETLLRIGFRFYWLPLGPSSPIPSTGSRLCRGAVSRPLGPCRLPSPGHVRQSSGPIDHPRAARSRLTEHHRDPRRSLLPVAPAPIDDPCAHRSFLIQHQTHIPAPLLHLSPRLPPRLPCDLAAPPIPVDMLPGSGSVQMAHMILTPEK